MQIGTQIFNYRISELQFNVTPPPTVTTSAPDEVYGASELSLIVDKADSIEEEDEGAALESNQKTTFSSDDIVIEEETIASWESVESGSRKPSVVAIEIVESQPKQQSRPIEATHPPPTSTSTQTVPTEEFPEASFTSTVINQAGDIRETAQFNVETQQETKIEQEIDACTRSIKDYDDASAKTCSSSFEDQQQKECLLAHQQSMSQEDDYEVSMVSGLLPGCVAPAPTPAPSIAPLAETEVDPAEDDTDNFLEPCENVEQKPEVERKKKRKEKRDREGGEGQSHSQTEADCSTDPDKSKRNAVCPWEDE